MGKLMRLDFSRTKDNIFAYLSVFITIGIYFMARPVELGMRYGIIVAIGVFIIMVNDIIELEEGFEKLMFSSGIKRETYFLYKCIKIAIVAIFVAGVAFLLFKGDFEIKIVGVLVLIYIFIVAIMLMIREILSKKVYITFSYVVYIFIFILMVNVEKSTLIDLSNNTTSIVFFCGVIILCFIGKWYGLKRRDY